MKIPSRAGTWVVASIFLCISLRSLNHAQSPSPAPGKIRKEPTLTSTASGTFEVKLTPQPVEDQAADSNLARLSIDKQFHGDLEGSSKGEMLSAGTSVKDSAGYVAMERVSGTLKGRTGSFVLQHSGTLTRGTPTLVVRVVPDSGTDQLAGLAGTMTIKIESGKHFYEFDYSITEIR
jgi:hypothetical protein